MDVVTLLDELVGGGRIAKFEVEGRSYGAVRNFRKFQRPKKPHYFHPRTPGVEEWTCLDTSEKHTSSVPVPHQSPTDPPVGGKPSPSRPTDATLEQHATNVGAAATISSAPAGTFLRCRAFFLAFLRRWCNGQAAWQNQGK